MLSTSLTDEINSLNAQQRALLARQIRQWLERAETIVPIPLQAKQEGLALTTAQQRLFDLRGQADGARAHAVVQKVALDGPLQSELFQKSLALVMERHPVFRTSVAMKNGVAHQVQGLRAAQTLERFDWRSEAGAQARLQQLCHEFARSQFDLAGGALFRMALVSLAPQRHIFLFATHNMVFDAWSYTVLLDELSAFYNAASRSDQPLPAVPGIDFFDYAAWQRNRDASKRYQDRLRQVRLRLGAAHGDDLRLDRPRGRERSYAGARIGFAVPAAVRERLLQIGGQHGASRFMTWLAGLQGYLAKHMGMRRFALGTINANRANREVEQVMGYFLNLIPIGADIDPSRDRFADVVQRAKAATVAALDSSDIYIEDVAAGAGLDFEANRNPYFDVLFSYEQTASSAHAFDALQCQVEDLDKGTARYDLSFAIYDEAERCHGWIEYNSALYTAQTAQALADGLTRWLTALADAPEQLLQDCGAHP